MRNKCAKGHAVYTLHYVIRGFVLDAKEDGPWKHMRHAALSEMLVNVLEKYNKKELHAIINTSTRGYIFLVA